MTSPLYRLNPLSTEMDADQILVVSLKTSSYSSLGLTHDGDDPCSSEADRGTVMARTVMSTLYNYAWSKCSKEQFHSKSK